MDKFPEIICPSCGQQMPCEHYPDFVVSYFYDMAGDEKLAFDKLMLELKKEKELK